MLKTILRRFRRDESGAVTVDWVVLCAIVIAMAIAVISLLQTGAIEPATALGNWLTAREV